MPPSLQSHKSDCQCNPCRARRKREGAEDAPRAKKERGISKKGSYFWIQWTDGEGNRHREKAGATLTQARQLLEKKRTEALQGKKLPELNRRRAITLAELVKKYAAETRANKKSWKWDERIAGHWVEVLGEEGIDSIQPGDIERIKARWLESGGKRNGKTIPLSPGTMNRRLAYLKTLFGKAVRDGLLDRNPLAARRVKMLRESAPPDRFLSPEEQAAVMAQLPRLDQLAMVVALQTGLRQSEELERCREDIDLKKGLLFIPEAKGGGRQEVFLNQVARAALREVLDSHPHQWVFPSPDGTQHLSQNTLADRFQRACQKAGVKGVSWHTLRHTFISRLCLMGVPLPTVQKLARHKSIAMTLRYSHLCPSHLQESLENLGAAFPESTAS